MKVVVIRRERGFEVAVLRRGDPITKEFHETLNDALCAAKYLSVEYSAAIENRHAA